MLADILRRMGRPVDLQLIQRRGLVNGSNLSVTYTIPKAVNPATSFVLPILSYTDADTTAGNATLTRVAMSADGTTVTLTKDASGNAADYWDLYAISGVKRVQRLSGTTNTASTPLTLPTPIADPNKTLVIVTNSTTNTGTQGKAMRAYCSALTTTQVTIYAAGSPYTYEVQVVEF